jgi:cell wall-associated NlpC family hydrolase
LGVAIGTLGADQALTPESPFALEFTSTLKAKALSSLSFLRQTSGLLMLVAVLIGCGTAPQRPPSPTAPASPFERRSNAEAAPHPRMADLLLSAFGLVGVPYRLGGNHIDNGFDCSGFTRHLYLAHLDVTLPRRSQEQAGAAGFVDVPPHELQPGDLVFFNTLNRRYSHVGIYVGEGRFIHAPRTGAQVRLEAIGARYWLQRYDGARRLVMS